MLVVLEDDRITELILGERIVKNTQNLLFDQMPFELKCSNQGEPVAFVLFSKTLPYSVINGVRVWLDGGHKETPIISEILFLAWF